MGELAVEALDLRSWRFIERWTLKEALAKAMGLGLRLPFDKVGFAIQPTGIRLVTYEVVFPIPHEQWHFEQWAADERHLVALAVRRGHSRSASFITRRPL